MTHLLSLFIAMDHIEAHERRQWWMSALLIAEAEVRIYRYADLKERKIVNSRMTCWRWVKLGLLPPPIDLGPNSIGFDADRVDAMIAGRQRPAKSESA